jgi:hypothetical protein
MRKGGRERESMSRTSRKRRRIGFSSSFPSNYSGAIYWRVRISVVRNEYLTFINLRKKRKNKLKMNFF